MKSMMHYNIPQNKFVTDKIYTSFSKVGNYLISGYVGPDGSTAIDFNKLCSMRKAFSEILERRALSVGGIPGSKNKVIAINIIKRDIEYIDMKWSSYSLDKNYPIDTTGAAAHTNSELAIYNSLKELLEKNALFLFWYGFMGKRFIYHYDNHVEAKILKIFHSAQKKIFHYINDYFYPLRVVITFVMKDNYIYSSGVGSSFCIREAVNTSIQEAYLLLWKDETLKLIKGNNIKRIYNYENHDKYLNHLSNFNEIASIDFSSDHDKKNYKLDSLLEVIPDWVKAIYLVPLKQYARHGIKCVRMVSPYMYNHIPVKEYININNPMNKNTICITQSTLSTIPDCIIL
ncbi:YcaO-like family protein [Paenibacillus thiaminolyticus]|uniref:YcaO-like family protein n=1 Tax=Paenibacillus thiaminolyticus TaxID=49283 RepID=UPI00232E3DAD|nr:YcaO-like family protein [Paenibacillus thiaminolyticus]WCF11056.1 YcaO-like family protein [Paenibacillus thiaminolyticus]